MNDSVNNVLNHISECFSKYKDAEMNTLKTFNYLWENLENDMILCRQKLELLQDKYADDLPREVEGTLDDTITNLQLMDSQIVELYHFINRHFINKIVEIDHGNL